MPNPLAEDLTEVLNRTSELWEELRGNKLFITGGTGFFGCWLLESFIHANEHLDLQASAVVLTRDPAAFKQKAAHLATNPAISFISGDIGSLEFPSGEFSHVIHAATDVYSQSSPLNTIDTIVSGTRRVLDFAVRCGAKKFLFVSSGAVYGRQPPAISHVGEEYAGAPDVGNINSAYGESKRLAELLCAVYAGQYEIEIKIARCFAFVGPYLQLDGHLAIGNFIKDYLDGNPIRVGGDGTPVRSYLYAADLTVWLWTILFRGAPNRSYNVGSEKEISIIDLARMISALSGDETKVEAALKPVSADVLPERYVPQTKRAFSELGLGAATDLETALRKTVEFCRETMELKRFSK